MELKEKWKRLLAGYHDYIKSVKEIYTAEELSKLVPQQYKEAFKKLIIKQIEFVKRMVEENIDPEILSDGIEKLQELKKSLDRMGRKDRE